MGNFTFPNRSRGAHGSARTNPSHERVSYARLLRQLVPILPLDRLRRVGHAHIAGGPAARRMLGAAWHEVRILRRLVRWLGTLPLFAGERLVALDLVG